MDNGDRSGAGAGAVGSAGSLGLRVGQAVFSSASLLFMSVGVEFFSYTAFWYVPFLRSIWFGVSATASTALKAVRLIERVWSGGRPNPVCVTLAAKQLPGDDHGAGHPLELHAGHDRRVLRVRGMPSARAGRHGHRRGRRLRTYLSTVFFCVPACQFKINKSSNLKSLRPCR